jgi:hypothetical protein
MASSVHYTPEFFKRWQEARKRSDEKAREQAYKDIKATIGQAKCVGLYWDVWQVGVTKVFSLEQQNLNKELTFL